jgi:hypothetical protein
MSQTHSVLTEAILSTSTPKPDTHLTELLALFKGIVQTIPIAISLSQELYSGKSSATREEKMQWIIFSEV